MRPWGWPTTTFFLISLQLIFPALAACWLLAFILPFDDLEVGHYTSGPGAVILPVLISSRSENCSLKGRKRISDTYHFDSRRENGCRDARP